MVSLILFTFQPESSCRAFTIRPYEPLWPLLNFRRVASRRSGSRSMGRGRGWRCNKNSAQIDCMHSCRSCVLLNCHTNWMFLLYASGYWRADMAHKPVSIWSLWAYIHSYSMFDLTAINWFTLNFNFHAKTFQRGLARKGMLHSLATKILGRPLPPP